MDVREGASGASADAPGRRSENTVSLSLNWQMTKNSDIHRKIERRGRQLYRKTREKCQILLKSFVFLSGILDFLILGLFFRNFSGYICVGLDWPLVLKWTLTLLRKMLPYIYGSQACLCKTASRWFSTASYSLPSSFALSKRPWRVRSSF